MSENLTVRNNSVEDVDVRVYERKGDKVVHEMFVDCVRFTLSKLLTDEQISTLPGIKVKRVHCPKAISTNALGTSYYDGWTDEVVNSDLSVKDSNGDVADMVSFANELDKTGRHVISVRNGSINGGHSYRGIVDQLRTLVHEVVHVVQKHTGRLQCLIGRNSYGNLMNVSKVWEGKVKSSNDWVIQNDYYSQPWEGEAEFFQTTIRDEFLESSDWSVEESGGVHNTVESLVSRG